MVATKKQAAHHPLDPLNESEIVQVSQAISKHFTEQTSVKAIKFLYITLLEPPKLDVLRHLGIATSSSQLGRVEPSATTISRKAESSLVDMLTGDAYTVAVCIESEEKSFVESVTKLPEGVQPGITLEELVESENIVKNDPKVIEICKEIGVKPEEICADGWSIGWDHRFGKGRRLQQCLMYARFKEHSNLYSHPLDFFPVVDSNEHKVIHIDFAAHRDKDGKLSAATGPPSPGSNPVEASGRERIKPPTEVHDYLPDFLTQQKNFKLREDIKPLHVVQPDGVSFEMNGNVLSWQNWKLHVGFNFREGVVLNTVTYNDRGLERPLFHRISLAEMVVPYGAPEHPHPRKFAFDVGEYGMGMLANSLELGCDCLGTIKYLDGVCSGHDGRPVVIKNAICIHEEDGGVLWKHSDFRPGGRAHAVRSRKLLIQMTATVANYEYILAFVLKQDGTIELEVKLTGILNLYVMAEGENTDGFGTEVAPRVMAHNHQHLFSIRLDPMIDGLENSLYETNVVPLPQPTGSEENFSGNGFRYQKTLLKTSSEAVRNYESTQNRTWTIANNERKHYSTKAPIGYKIMCKDFPVLLAKDDSWVARRAPFSKYHVTAVPYADGRLYPAGKYVPQTEDAPEDSLEGWFKGAHDIVQKDMLVFVTFGVTHVPRPEDYPVMPVETASLMLKPNGFFDQNPALDVPQAQDKLSKNAFLGGHSNGISVNGGAPNGVNGVNGHANGTNGNCCH